MKEIIHIYHINDLHSHFDHWARIVEYMNTNQKLFEEAGEAVYKVDIGDHVDRVHPFTEGTMGKGNIRLLNEAGFDLATIGNNEGITLPFAALNDLYEDASFPIILANLFYQDGSRPKWATPYQISVTPNGNRVAFLGVTAPFYEVYREMGWDITDPFKAIEKVLQEIKGQADIVILLSHLGIKSDEILAEKFPDLTVILGGHTHHILHTGKRVNQTLICGAGKFGMYVGHVEIAIEDGRIRTTATLADMADEVPTVVERDCASFLYEEGKEALSSPVARLIQPLKTDWFHQSELPLLLCEGLREWCEADCAFLNAGLLLDDLEGEQVTKYDIHKICPHPINPCVVTVKGKDLREILNETLKPEWPHFQVRGLGFRGKVMGAFVYNQLHVDELELGNVWSVAGEPIEDEREYRLAIPDMFTFGYLFPLIREVKNKKYYMPEFLRDILVWKLSQSSL